VTLRRDAESLFGVLVNPFLLKPFTRLRIVGRNEMKLLWVDPFRMPKRDYMGGQQKIEWLNLLCIGLIRVQSIKAFHQIWAAYGRSTNCWKVCKFEPSCPPTGGFANNCVPDRRSPIAVGVASRSVGLSKCPNPCRDHQSFVLFTFYLKRAGSLPGGPQEKQVALCRDCAAVNLPLFSSLGIKIVILNFEH
jgi:hypothetical protein